MPSMDNPVPEILDRAVTNIIDEPSKSIGRTISDIWFLVFGGMINHLADKRRLWYAKDLENFKASLDANISEIPANKLAAPDLQVVGPALEDAKYCVGNESIRSMFAKLIASSLHIDKRDHVYPIFSANIKAMSALDAQNIALFNNRPLDSLAVVQYRFQRGDSWVTVEPCVCLENPSETNIEKQAISFFSLQQLGFLTIDFSTLINSPSKYEPYKHHPIFIGMCEYAKTKAAIDAGITSAAIRQGSISLTSLGKAFLDVCL